MFALPSPTYSAIKTHVYLLKAQKRKTKRVYIAEQINKLYFDLFLEAGQKGKAQCQKIAKNVGHGTFTFLK